MKYKHSFFGEDMNKSFRDVVFGFTMCFLIILALLLVVVIGRHETKFFGTWKDGNGSEIKFTRNYYIDENEQLHPYVICDNGNMISVKANLLGYIPVNYVFHIMKNNELNKNIYYGNIFVGEDHYYQKSN